MAERPYSRYSRAKTWAALYSQHLTAGYALVPYSSTNNSIAVISCLNPKNAAQDIAKDTQEMANLLLGHAEECAAFYTKKQPRDLAPAFLARVRQAVVLAKSSDYYHYHLENHPDLKLVICGLHDSYLHLPVWEMRTNRRYKARETAVAITAADFDRLRRTQFGHHILVAAVAKGDPDALAFIEKQGFPARTRSRIRRESDALHDQHYRGRPLAFLTESERREVGLKISAGLRRYHEHKRLKAV
jgi:hypothetical protein